jgi:hypothetical protein
MNSYGLVLSACVCGALSIGALAHAPDLGVWVVMTAGLGVLGGLARATRAKALAN